MCIYVLVLHMMNIIDRNFIIHSLVDKHVDWFQFLTIVKRAAQRWKTACLETVFYGSPLDACPGVVDLDLLEDMILGF